MDSFAIEKNNKPSSALRRAVIVLCVLLLLSLIALAAVLTLGFRRNTDTDVVPDNQIGKAAIQVAPVWRCVRTGALDAMGSEQEIPRGATVELYQGHGEENLPFQVSNMLPGDRYTQHFAVEVSHGDPVKLYFHALITAQTKNLSRVLTIRVVHLESGKVIYDGTFENLPVSGYPVALPQAADGKTAATYEIQVSLPASTGNAYQQAMLRCDLQWYVSDQGSLRPPQTGDSFSALLWGGLALLSAGGIALLTVLRKKEADHA